MESHPYRRKNRRTDERTNGMDENYIPLWHTSKAGGIIMATFLGINAVVVMRVHCMPFF